MNYLINRQIEKEAQRGQKVIEFIVKHPYLVLGGGMATMGVGTGVIKARGEIKEDIKKKKKSSQYHPTQKGYRAERALIYGKDIAMDAFPAGIGGLFMAYRLDRAFGEEQSGYSGRQYQPPPGGQYQPPPSQPREPVYDDFATMGIEKKDIKTKVDLKNIYRKAAFRQHPDRGGNPVRMKAINTAMERIRKTQWYNKLASGYSNFRINRCIEKVAGRFNLEREK